MEQARWTDGEVQALLSIYADDQIQRGFETGMRNDKVYATISCKLSELNIHHSTKQCREKIKKLKQDYKRIKDHNDSGGGDRRTSKWFDRLDAVLGDRRPPLFSGAAATDADNVKLEVVMVELDSERQSVNGIRQRLGGGRADSCAGSGAFLGGPASAPLWNYISEEGSMAPDDAMLVPAEPESTPAASSASMTPPQHGYTGQMDRWTDDEVQALLSICAEDEIQWEFETATRNGKAKVYNKISCKLSERNIHRTAKRCREKLKKLKQDYRKTKDLNSRSGCDRRTSKWFDRLDAVLGDRRPAFSGATATEDEANVKLEAMMVGDETDSQSVEDYISISEDGSVTTVDALLVPAEPAPTPATATSSASMPQQRVFTGRRKRHREQEHLAALREMAACDAQQQQLNRAQMELSRAQRERHVRMALDDAARARELEAALRREESAQTAAFNMAFLGTLGQLVQVLSGRRDPVPPPLD